MKKNNLAFTLLEIMVVLIILGIIMSLAIPNYQSAQRRQAQKDARAFLIVVQAAMNANYQRNYPTLANIDAINNTLGTKFDPQGEWRLNTQNCGNDFYVFAVSEKYGRCSITKNTSPVCPAGNGCPDDVLDVLPGPP